MNRSKKKEIYFWLILILLVIVLSLPSAIRVYEIKNLFLSGKTRSDAVLAVTALRDNRGYGATDLSLKKIVIDGDRNIFYFKYQYPHPQIDSKKSLEIRVEKDGKTLIKDL